MALTKETLRANEALAGLSDEQVDLIETLSRNDENTVIANRIGQLHGDYDADILAATGIAKQQGEKTYDYLKRAAGEIKRRADKSDEFQQKVTALTGERDALREQLKAGGAGDLSAQLAAKEAELKNTKKLYADTKADLDKLTKESVSKMTALQIGYEIKGAAAALKFKPEIPQAVADLAVQNIVKEMETAHKPEFIPDGNGGHRLVFKDENGVQFNNPANGLQPFTAAELLTQKLSALGILAEGQKQAGAGTKATPGNAGGSRYDIGGARTQVEADEMIVEQLCRDGFVKGTPEFTDEHSKIRAENKVQELPLR